MCGLPKIDFDANALKGQAATTKVTVTLSISRDGTIGAVETQGAPSESIADDIRKGIGGWLIALVHDGNETITQKKALRSSNFLLRRFSGSSGNSSVQRATLEWAFTTGGHRDYQWLARIDRKVEVPGTSVQIIFPGKTAKAGRIGSSQEFHGTGRRARAYRMIPAILLGAVGGQDPLTAYFFVPTHSSF